MTKIGITTDSASDLAEEIVKRYNIGIANFKVDLQKIKDLPGNIFEKMRQAQKQGIDSAVKTSQPAMQEYLRIFKKGLESFEEIIHISMSSGASGAYNSAMQAKKFLGKDSERVHILDSEQASGAQSLLIIKALEDIEKKLKVDEIVNNFNKRIKTTFIYFTYDDPKWLISGGRVPFLAGFGLKKMKEMNIGLLMHTKDGVIKPLTLKKNMKDLATPLFEEFKKKTKNIQSQIKVIITHADNPSEANKLREMLNSMENVDVLYSSIMDVVLGAHTGPNTLLINFQYE